MFGLHLQQSRKRLETLQKTAQPLAPDFSMWTHEQAQTTGHIFSHNWPNGAERIWKEELITKMNKATWESLNPNQVSLAGSHLHQKGFFLFNYKPRQKRFCSFDGCIVLILLPHPSP